MKFITLSDILYLKADNTYTIFFLKNGQKYASTKPISHYETLLNPDYFFRIHKSYVVNIGGVKEYHSGGTGNVLMEDRSSLPVSRYRQTDFLALLKNYLMVIKT